MKITTIDSKVTGIERFSLVPGNKNKNAGLLVRVPEGVDLKAMLAKGPLFIRSVPK